MERTNFTFVSRSGLLALLLVAFGWAQSAQAQCDPPSNLAVSYDCDGAVTITWDAADGANDYTLVVDDVTVDPAENVVTRVGLSGTTVTITPGTLDQGVSYNYSITSNCDGGLAAGANGIIDGASIEDRLPTLTLSNETDPSCPDATDGSIEVLLDDDCGGRYAIILKDGAGAVVETKNRDAGSSPTFSGLGVGSYTFELELLQANGCNLSDACVESVSASFELVSGDVTAPTVTVTSPIEGNIVDGDAFTYATPEGECGVQLNYAGFYDDNCGPDGVDFDINVTNPNLGVFPSVQVVDGVAGPNSFSIFVFAAIGTNTVTLTATDEDDNTTTLSFSITVPDQRVPEIYGPGNMNVLIPSCEDGGVPVNWTVSTVDDCDIQPTLTKTAGPSSGDVLTVGTYTVTYTSTDDFGNTASYSFTISVTQAASPAPIVDLSGNGQFTVPACDESTFVVFSGNIYDCDITDGSNPTIGFDDDGSGLAISFVNTQDGFAYFEATGQVAPGTYLPVVTYDGVTVDHLVEVSQDADTPAEIDMPGNLSFLEPVCEAGAAVNFRVKIEDDCDTDLSGASFTLNGAPAPAVNAGQSDPANGVYVWTLAGIPAGSYTLGASYTDGGNNTTTEEVTLVVTDQPDTWAPIISYPSQDYSLELDPCEFNATETISFLVTATDNCLGAVTPSVTASGGSLVNLGGGRYELTVGPGSYTVSISATDGTNTSSASFNVTATQAPAPNTNLSCTDNTILPLDAACQREVTATMVLSGSLGCALESDFDISIVTDDDPSNGNYLDGCGEFIYEVKYVGPAVRGNFNFIDCWGYITGEDKADPVITCPPNTNRNIVTNRTFFCTDFDSLFNVAGSTAITGMPSASDNCDTDVDISFVDTYTSVDCGTTVITRTFTAVDDKGNTDVCEQRIFILTPTLNNVVRPAPLVEIDCDEDYPTLDNGNPAPSVTGIPFIITGTDTFQLADDYCNLGATFEDGPRITVCEGTFKFQRHWTLLDWCYPNRVDEVDQLVKVGDFEGPTVTCPEEDYDWDGVADTLVYSTSPFSCLASFAAPMPVVEDNCSSWEVRTEVVTEVTSDVVNQYGIVTGTRTDTVVVDVVEAGASSRIVGGIPVGNHYFRYTVTDACGNKTVVYCPFSVEDRIEPTAVCDDNLNISIGGQDFARVYAADIDEGSSDNCGPVTIEVRRDKYDVDDATCGSEYSAWGDYVDFFCCDVGVTVTIELRVTDASGNVNTCWLEVVPEDKANPYCYAPHPKTVGCDELSLNFDPLDTLQLQELFGDATSDDNCDSYEIELTPVPNLECGFGTITRTFRAIDIHGNTSSNTCKQVVTIEEVHNYEIKFPADAEAICGVAEPDSVTYNEIGCDLLAVNHTDEFFSASGDECYKIFRTWKVINWCQYDGEGDPYVVTRDEDCDGTPGECIWLLYRPDGFLYFDEDNDETEPNNIPTAAQNACGDNDDYYTRTPVDELSEQGFYQYVQIIKVYDDIEPQISFDAQDPFCSLDNVNCDGRVVFPFSVDENCTPDDLTISVSLDAGDDGTIDLDLLDLTDGLFDDFTLTGTYPDYELEGRFPIGTHSFQVIVEDGCGNDRLADLPFEVIDCKAPSPVCINGLAIELMPFDVDGDDVSDEGRMAIWASDFIASPITDCSEPITYSINRAGEPNDVDSTGIVLTCEDTGTLVIEIWAYDAAGNSDFCETYILVQDNMDVCTPGPLTVGAAGAIATETSSSVENVEVSLSGQGSATVMTSAEGAYNFAGLQEGYDYTVTPQLDANYLNGVSTFDLVLISKHILGVQPLGSPYKMIAADVNNSESITTLDLIQLRKLILSIDTEFSNNTSWRFVERGYSFPNAANPWFEDFPEVVNINDLPANGIDNADFVAVKVGDVNLDAETNSLASVEGRTLVGTLAFEVANQAVKAGNEYTVEFKASGIATIDGYQATLSLDKSLELVDIISGAATEDNFGLSYLNEGLITTSWNGKAAAEEVLFSLVVRASADAQLSELMAVNSRITKAEAYNRSGEYLGVGLQFSGQEVAAAGFELYQNQPNPFKGETVIGFNLPAEDNVTLTVSDVSGKVLKLVRLDGVKGYNQVVVNSSTLPMAGVLYYTVKTADYTATKKMVIIE